MKNKWLALMMHILFFAPISVILAFALFFQMLYILVIDKFNPFLFLVNSYYREIYSSTFFSFLLYLALSFYFIYMSILNIDTMFKLMHEAFSNENKKDK
jgi:uncharacterized BrkB/YihY/UPF0761 family membrane protein